MKSFRKVFSLFICLTVFILIGSVADRAEAAAPGGTYELNYMSSDKSKVGIKVDIGGRAEVGLWNASGKMVQSVECISYAYFTNLKKNRLYYFRVRGLTYDSVQRAYTASTDWSAAKAFVTADYKLTLVSRKSRIVRFKFPKVTGVKSYVLYMSTKEASGYKKVKTVKPGGTYKVSKFKNKSFVYKKNYYYKIVPKLKTGGKAAAYVDGFYIYKVYG